ncbi:MAG: hypothetical protein K2Q12_08190 [Rickettsiales bacterium]|nr:hypothetical protein [Rickettsiales bacterium]
MTKELDRKAKYLMAIRQFNALRAAGCSLSDLRAAGCSANALLAAGYSLSDLRAAGYSLSDLRAAGCSANALLAAGYSLSALLAAGYSPSALRAAGYSLSDLRAAGCSANTLLEEAPLLKKPYSQILADIRAKKRRFSQSTFGPKIENEEHLCGTAMCTAGHLINLAGEAGWALKEKYDYATAAALIHEKAHPNYPCQDFGSIPDDVALAYIETMAEIEQQEEAA